MSGNGGSFIGTRSLFNIINADAKVVPNRVKPKARRHFTFSGGGEGSALGLLAVGLNDIKSMLVSSDIEISTTPFALWWSFRSLILNVRLSNHDLSVKNQPTLDLSFAPLDQHLKTTFARYHSQNKRLFRRRPYTWVYLDQRR